MNRSQQGARDAQSWVFSRRRQAERPPSLLLRVTALGCFPCYVATLCWLLSNSVEQPLSFVSALVAVWIGAQAAILGVFAVRIHRHRERVFRFRVSTILLLTVMAAIYFAGFRWLFDSMPPAMQFANNRWAPISVIVLMAWFALINTALLIVWMEAVVWLAVSLLQLRSSHRRRRLNAAEGPARDTLENTP